MRLAPPAVLAACLAMLALAAHAAAAPVPAERALYGDGPNGRHLLDRGWETRADPRDVGRRRDWHEPRARGRWQRVSVPHAFNATDRTTRGFDSRVQWYRVRFDLPRDRGAAGWRLRFESVNREATVWLNGRKLGSHEGAHLPFELVAKEVRERDNVLVVRVDGRLSMTDLPTARRPRGWWNYGGILREVYLRRVGTFDLADLQVVGRPGSRATVEWRVRVRNASARRRDWEVEATLFDPEGRVVTGEAVGGGALRPRGLAIAEGETEIARPRMWTPSTPTLYRLELRVPGGQVLTTHFGIREWGVENGRATLNDRPLDLRGASFHEQVGSAGAALGASERGTIVSELRALAADFTRQHYPPHPALLEAFDRAGIVFWEQVPVWRLRSRDLRSRRVRSEALSRLRQAIVRDRNHASVMAWSVENETLRGGEAQERYVRSAAALVRKLDRTRLVAADTALRPVDQVPDVYSVLDAIGVNEYVGWYGEGEASDVPVDFAELRRRFPRQALFVTEFGAEANRSGPATEKGTYEYQRRWLDEHLAAIDSTDASGAAVWALRDFWVRPGWHGGNPRPDPPWNRKGLFDDRGRPKPAVDLVRQRFAAVNWDATPPPVPPPGGGLPFPD
jgi:beta-glucuronidase